jgi:hypothetical protein
LVRPRWRCARGVPISSFASEATRDAKGYPIARHTLRFGKHEIPLPTWRPLRVLLGIAFLIGGLFAILPVLGLWMIPVGFLILSVDFPPIRRFRRRTVSWYGRSRLRDAVGGLSRIWGRAWGRKKGPSG